MVTYSETPNKYCPVIFVSRRLDREVGGGRKMPAPASDTPKMAPGRAPGNVAGRGIHGYTPDPKYPPLKPWDFCGGPRIREFSY